MKTTKEYIIGGFICYDLNKDGFVGYPNGIRILATSLEEAAKIAEKYVADEAAGYYKGFANGWFAKDPRTKQVIEG